MAADMDITQTRAKNSSIINQKACCFLTDAAYRHALRHTQEHLYLCVCWAVERHKQHTNCPHCVTHRSRESSQSIAVGLKIWLVWMWKSCFIKILLMLRWIKKEKLSNSVQFTELESMKEATIHKLLRCRWCIALVEPLGVRAASLRKCFSTPLFSQTNLSALHLPSAVGDKARLWCMQQSSLWNRWTVWYWWLTCLNLALASFSFILPWATR